MTRKDRLRKLLTVQCGRCTKCCRAPIVTVTHHDVKRLVKATGRPAGRIVRLYSTEDLDCPADDQDWVRLSYGRRMIGIPKRDGHCAFLSDAGTCEVHPHRPAACRTYPVDVIFDADHNVVDAELTDTLRSGHVRCKHVYGPASLHRQHIRNATRALKEYESYWRKVARWNRRPQKGNKADFLAFLGL